MPWFPVGKPMLSSRGSEKGQTRLLRALYSFSLSEKQTCLAENEGFRRCDCLSDIQIVKDH